MIPKISVIIPVYNRVNTLKDAIESVLRQDYPMDHVELIVVDDGSEIDIYSFLLPYIPRIKYIKEPLNLGVSASRNIGVFNSSGDYIAFLDSDDLWLGDKLRLQVEQMFKDSYEISHTGELWYKNGKYINQGKMSLRYGGYIFDHILDKCRVSPSSFLIKKSIYEEYGGFNEDLRVCEDYDFFIRLAINEKFSYLNRNLIIKRAICDNSLSASIKHIESIRLRILENIINLRYLNDTQRNIIENEIWRKQSIVKKDCSDFA